MTYRLKHPGDGSITYPFYKEQLPAAFPQTSFRLPIPDEIAAEFGCLPVVPAERPNHDPRTQRLEEHDPEELEDGTLRQVVTVRPATPEEIAAWDAANQPAPDWMGFGLALATSPGIAALYAALPGPVANALSIGLSEAAKGDARLFTSIWGHIFSEGAVSAELLAEIIAAATDSHLPQELIGSLGGMPELLRARNPDGTFVADDPFTPEDEAWAPAPLMAGQVQGAAATAAPAL